MRKINVDYTLLLQYADHIDEITNEYHRLYNHLYNNVETMEVSWKGKDNMAFTSQIKSFSDNFNKMSVVLRQYSSFLKNSANSYRQTQDELVNHVNRLSN